MTFLVATSSKGRQVRVTLGRWPLLTVDEARALALPILRDCRSGQWVRAATTGPLPTLSACLSEYATAKKVKGSSLERYRSMLRTHFPEWTEMPVSALAAPAFGEHCLTFAQTKGAALVGLGRGLIGSLLKYVGAVYGLKVVNPFERLALAGLMPGAPRARVRKLTKADLPAWRKAVDSLPALQRDYLMLVLLTGLRKNEGGSIRRRDVDLAEGILTIPETKGGNVHSLPITAPMRDILERRCENLTGEQLLFAGVSAGHVNKMAIRVGAPAFALHDLRKLLASVGARLGTGDAILKRILGHAAKRSDVLHRHYVSLDCADIRGPLAAIQAEVSL